MSPPRAGARPQYTFEPLDVLTGETALEDMARTVLQYSAGPVDPAVACLVRRPPPRLWAHHTCRLLAASQSCRPSMCKCVIPEATPV